MSHHYEKRTLLPAEWLLRARKRVAELLPYAEATPFDEKGMTGEQFFMLNGICPDKERYARETLRQLNQLLMRTGTGEDRVSLFIDMLVTEVRTEWTCEALCKRKQVYELERRLAS